MSQRVVKGIRLSLQGPDSLALPVVRRGSPTFDARKQFFVVTLTNVSDASVALPLGEMSRSIVLVYRNQETRKEIIDNRTPPPKRDGAVETIAKGESRTFQVVFGYPEPIVTFHDRVARIQFCVLWDANWLRKESYRPASYDWNESYELCREVRIVDE